MNPAPPQRLLTGAGTSGHDGKEFPISASGLSAVRLRRLGESLTRHVGSGDMPGLVALVALVARRGEVHVEAIGTMAAGGSEPMRRDTIFRIASVTKQIAAAAAMAGG